MRKGCLLLAFPHIQADQKEQQGQNGGYKERGQDRSFFVDILQK